MLPDRTTRLVDLQGLHREVLKNALDSYLAELKKLEKNAEKNGVKTDVERLKRGVNLLKFCIGARANADEDDDDDESEERVGKVESQDDLWDGAADEDDDPLEPEGVNLDDDEVIVTMLLLVDGSIPDATEEDIRKEVKTWDTAARREVYRWSRAIQLHASDHDDIIVPPKPKAVPIEWVGQIIRAAIEKGQVDAETLKPIELAGPQVDYWLEQGPWRIAEYSVTSEENKAAGSPPEFEYAVEWAEAVAEGAEPPVHGFVYDTREEGREVAARLNRRVRTEGKTEQHVAEVEGEPLPINEALLTAELQTAVQADLNPDVAAPAAMGIGAIRTWYRAGPWQAELYEDDRYRIVRDNGNGVMIGALTSYDVYEAHVRAAVMNQNNFNSNKAVTATGADASISAPPGEPEPTVTTLPPEENEAAAAVTKGKKKAAAKTGAKKPPATKKKK